MPLLAAALAFITIVVLVVGLWWVQLPARKVADRLRKFGRIATGIDTELYTSPAEELAALRAQGRVRRRLGKLVDQAGYAGRETDVLMVIAMLIVTETLLGWLRLGKAWAP